MPRMTHHFSPFFPAIYYITIRSWKNFWIKFLLGITVKYEINLIEHPVAPWLSVWAGAWSNSPCQRLLCFLDTPCTEYTDPYLTTWGRSLIPNQLSCLISCPWVSQWKTKPWFYNNGTTSTLSQSLRSMPLCEGSTNFSVQPKPK